MKPIDDRLLEFMLENPAEPEVASALYGEVRDLRLSFQRLHRRCQRAEAAAAGKLRHAQPKTFGRGLMAWAYAEEKKRNEELEAKLRKLEPIRIPKAITRTVLRGLDEIARCQQS